MCDDGSSFKHWFKVGDMGTPMLHHILRIARHIRIAVPLRRSLLAVVAILAGCALSDDRLVSSPADPSRPVPPLVSAQASSERITEISVQRICFRCLDVYTLTLRSDGTATLVHHGGGGRGAIERVQNASIGEKAFARLVDEVEKTSFSKLNEVYQFPDTFDGSAIITTVTWGTTRKKVINSNGAGPPELKSLENAIDAVAKALKWPAV